DVEGSEEESVTRKAHDFLALGQALDGELTGQLRHRLPFAQDHAVLEHLPSGEHGEHHDGTGAFGYLVLAGFQVAHVAAGDGQYREAQGASNPPDFVEDLRYVEEPAVSWYFDHAGTVPDRRAGGQHPPGLKRQEKQQADQHEAEEGPEPDTGPGRVRPAP